MQLAERHATLYGQAWDAIKTTWDHDHDGKADDPNGPHGLPRGVNRNAPPARASVARFGRF